LLYRNFLYFVCFFFSSRRRHTRSLRDWSSDVCSSDLASIDGIYVIRTSVKKELLPAEEAVRDYKRLSEVEQAFRSLKTVDLRVRSEERRVGKECRSRWLRVD